MYDNFSYDELKKLPYIFNKFIDQVHEYTHIQFWAGFRLEIEDVGGAKYVLDYQPGQEPKARKVKPSD